MTRSTSPSPNRDSSISESKHRDRPRHKKTSKDAVDVEDKHKERSRSRHSGQKSHYDDPDRSRHVRPRPSSKTRDEPPENQDEFEVGLDRNAIKLSKRRHRDKHSDVRGAVQGHSERYERDSPSRHKSSSRHFVASPVHRRNSNREETNYNSMGRNSDQYWSKYPSQDKEHSVGSRYYGEHSRSKPLDNKENLKRKNQPSMNDMPSSEDTKKLKGRHDESPAKETTNEEVQPVRQKKNMDLLTTKTGGAYIPPARLRMMQAQITDKTSAAYQRLSWEALKKSIHGHINKINTANIGIIVRELLKENVVRGRGLLCRSIIQAQAASPTFTHVYAALVAVINSRFPNIGELLLRRLIIQFKRGFKRNDKSICISAASFIAHLVNQRVSHEILALEILTLLVESPTDDSVEVAIAFLKECGMKLTEVSNKGIHAIFEMLRNILHEGHLDKRVQYMIEVMFQVRKDHFQDHKAVEEELDIVDEEDQFTHLLTLEDVKDGEDILNVFKFDPEFEENETKYKTLRKEILDEGSEDSGSDNGSEGDSEEESENEEENKESTIIDNTETNLVALRRTIYLTIHSSLDFEECAHKLMRMELKPGQEIELCHMFLDCCAEQRTYEKFYGLLSQRFCQINKIFIPPFQQIFRNTYETIHRLDTNKLRNVAKFFAHLLFTDAISWEVLSLIHLNEEETTSSSRIFIKILFQELSEYMGLTKLNDRVKDSTLQAAFDGLFPRDNPKNTRFAINFFTSIGLGGLTDELREHLKSQPKVAMVPKIVETLQVESGSSSSDSSSSSSSSETSSDSSSDSESDDSNDDRRINKSRKGHKSKHSNKKLESKRSQKKKHQERSVSKPKKKKKRKKSSK